MKKLYLQILLLAGLAEQPLLANADDDDRNRRSWSGADALDWRLGAGRGDYGQEIFYRVPGDRRWHRAPGRATDLSDGWVLGTDRRNGGYGIYRWNGRDWQRMPGAGVDIGGSFQNPWVVNERGERFVWSGYQWREDANYRRRDERRRNDRDVPERRRDYRRERDDRGDRNRW